MFFKENEEVGDDKNTWLWLYRKGRGILKKKTE